MDRFLRSGIKPVELLDLIYDTLMQNTQHEQFDPNKAILPQVDSDKNCITLSYEANDGGVRHFAIQCYELENNPLEE